MKRISIVTLGAAALLLTGCGVVPADAIGTYDRATDGSLVVGVSEHAPWTEVDDATGEVTGSEADLVHSFADSINAEIEWTDAPESVLAEQIKSGDLDLVIGGLTTSSPWTTHMALTRAYASVTSDEGNTENLVMGVRLGENELLTALERHLAQEFGEIS